MRFKPRKFSLVVILTTIFLLGLAGCTPEDIREVKGVVSDSATLAAVVSGDQPASQVRTATLVAPTKKPPSAPKNPTPSATPGKRSKDTPGDFDFYVLSLSWSPDYCAGNADDVQQCSVGKELGFVLHGLWPQYNRGYPADCSTLKLPKDAQQKFPGLYPNTALYTHEWSKHGTCSGLTPEEYLTLSKSLKESIGIPADYRSPAQAFRTTPDQLIAAFTAENPQLNEEALAVQCSGSGRFLQELRVCFSREGESIACSAEVQKNGAKSCGRADFLVRNVR